MYRLVYLASLFTNYKNKNWFQFLFIVKAAVLKQQISKFYPQATHTAVFLCWCQHHSGGFFVSSGCFCAQSSQLPLYVSTLLQRQQDKPDVTETGWIYA